MLITPAMSTDHSTVMISLSNNNSNNNGCGIWKYNSSLVNDEFYVEKMKKLIAKINTSNEFIKDAQMKW